MNYLPLSQVCKINMGQSPESSSYNENGDGLPFFQGNADFGERHPVTRVWCNAPTIIAHAGDILISVRAPIGAMNYASEECCIGRGLAAITPDSNKVSPEFIFWLLKGKNTELNSNETGSAFKAIGRRVLEEVLVPDIGLEQQAEYAQVLETIYAFMEERKEQLRTLDQLIKARFVELFGDPITNSKGFETRPGIEVFKLSNGKFVPENKRFVVGVPVYGDNGISWYTDEILCANDTVVVGRVGFQSGNVHLVEGPLWISDNAMYISDLVDDEYDLRFLYAVMDHIDFTRFQDAGDLKKITQKPFMQMQYIKPPLHMQHEYVAFVSQVDKSKLSIQASLNQLETLKKSLMQKYFG